MRTIKRITLHNYLSHKDTTLDDLGDSVCIKGPNQSGKSNIYNAVSLVHNNEDWPEQDLFIDKSDPNSKPSIEGYVEIEYSDGRIIRRSKTKSKNTYVLTYPDGRQEHLGTIRGAEDKINEFTGFIPMRLFKDDPKEKPVMVQMVPLDNTTPFLMTGTSPAGVLQAINRLSSGSLYDSARRLAETDHKKVQAELSALTRQSETLNTLLKSYEEKKVVEAESRLNDLIEANKKIDSLQVRQLGIEASIKECTSLSKVDFAGFKKSAEILREKLDEVTTGAEESISKKRAKLDAVNAAIVNIETLKSKIKSKMNTIKTLQEELEKIKDTVPICETCGRPL